jgi:site-specific DNA-methyltransferase (adenine-specific)
MGKSQPFFKIENICVFYAKSPTYNPQIIDGKPYKVMESHILQNGQQQKYCFTHKTDVINDGTRLPDNLLEYNSVGGNKLHPTQKPLDLIEWLVKSYTNSEDTVLDNCMGSGTTGVACKKLNRNFIGIELDPKYFEMAKERIEKSTFQIPLF